MLAVKRYSKESLKVLSDKLKAHLKSFFSEYEGFDGLFNEDEYWSARQRYQNDIYEGVYIKVFMRHTPPDVSEMDTEISYDSRVVHCLEMPIEDLALYVHSYSELVQIAVKWRLEQGK
jgi:hypothetical protein